MISAILVILVLAVSGCINNGSTPVPTPTATPVPTTTPSPTTTPGADAIVGLWEGSKNSITTTFQFSGDGKLVYNEGGNIASGAWIKQYNNQYKVGILGLDTVITLNDNMTQFNWKNELILTKKTVTG